MIKAIARKVAAAHRAGRPFRTIVLTGHADSRGSDEFNIRLGQARAEAVRSRLAAELNALIPGLSARLSFQVKSAGESDPRSSNTTDAGRARNRRVEVCLFTQSARSSPGPSSVGRCVRDCIGEAKRRLSRPLTRVEEIRLRRRCGRQCSTGVPV